MRHRRRRLHPLRARSQLHLTCCRQNIRPIESYDGISQDVLARNPPEFVRLLRMGDR